MSVQTCRSDSKEPERATVVLYRNAGQELPPGIAQPIDDHLTEFTGREVRVGFIEAQQTI